MGKNNKNKNKKPVTMVNPSKPQVNEEKSTETKPVEAKVVTKEIKRPKTPLQPPVDENSVIMNASDIITNGIENENVSIDTLATITKNLTDRYVNHPAKGQKDELVESMAGAGGIIDLFNVECVVRLLASGKMITLKNVENSAAYEQLKSVCGYFNVKLPDVKLIGTPVEGTLNFKDGENGVIVSEETKESIAQEETREKKTKTVLTVETATDDNLDLLLQRTWDEGKKVSLGNGFRMIIEVLQTYDHNHAKDEAATKAVDNRTIHEVIERIYSILGKGLLCFDALGKMLVSQIKNDQNPISAFLVLKGQLRILDDVNSVKDDSGDYVKKVYVYPFTDKEIAQIITSLVNHSLTGMIKIFDGMLEKANALKEGDADFSNKEGRINKITELRDSYSKVYNYMTMTTEADIEALKDNREFISSNKISAEEKEKLTKDSKVMFMLAGNYGFSSKDEKTHKTIVTNISAIRDIAKYIVNFFRPFDAQLSTNYILTAKTTEIKN